MGLSEWLGLLTVYRRYGSAPAWVQTGCAEDRGKYLALVDRVFQRSGQLWEKYDVCTGDISVSKEYQTPPMMGWTAGVYTAFQEIVHPRCS